MRDADAAFRIVALFLVFALLGSITGLAATVLLLLGLLRGGERSAVRLAAEGWAERAWAVRGAAHVPALGAAVCLLLIAVSVGTGDWRAPALAGALLLFALGIYAAMGRRDQ